MNISGTYLMPTKKGYRRCSKKIQKIGSVIRRTPDGTYQWHVDATKMKRDNLYLDRGRKCQDYSKYTRV
jgi:hypothetical protein